MRDHTNTHKLNVSDKNPSGYINGAHGFNAERAKLSFTDFLLWWVILLFYLLLNVIISLKSLFKKKDSLLYRFSLAKLATIINRWNIRKFERYRYTRLNVKICDVSGVWYGMVWLNSVFWPNLLKNLDFNRGGYVNSLFNFLIPQQMAVRNLWKDWDWDWEG